MAQFALKTQRTILRTIKFEWADGDEKGSAKLNAEFLIMPRDQLNEKAQAAVKSDDIASLDEAFLVVGLKSLSGLEIEGSDGKLEGEAYLEAARKDPNLCYALAKDYTEAMQKN